MYPFRTVVFHGGGGPRRKSQGKVALELEGRAVLAVGGMPLEDPRQVEGREPYGQLLPAARERRQQRLPVLRTPEVVGVLEAITHEVAELEDEAAGILRHPVERRERLLGQAQPLAADRELVQVKRVRPLKRREERVRLVKAAALDLGGRTR